MASSLLRLRCFTHITRCRVLLRYLSCKSAWQSSPELMQTLDTSALFNYTSGRWVYNEQRRLQERRRVFNVIELKRLAAVAVSREFDDILSFEKLGEGAANRAFTVTFRDGFQLVARVPYTVTQPEGLVVASEAATLTFLHSKGIPVPKVYGYSATTENPAETEYLFLQYSPGCELSTVWFEMQEHDRQSFIESLVDLEARLLNIHLPASGSLYFLRDLPPNFRKLAIDAGDVDRPESLYVGPSTSLDLWFGKRSGLTINRGHHTEVEAVLTAGAEKEILYLEHHGRPLFPFDRMRRETFNLEKQLPLTHLDSLRKYKQIAKNLIPEREVKMAQPVIRHPDLRPSNIFVSDDFKITSLIDWQHCVILPLYLHSGIPDDIDNLKDSVSRSLEEPRLSPDISGASEEEREHEMELFFKRQLHYFYMTETATNNPLHFAAMTYPFSIARRKIFQLSGSPWQGDNIPLQSSLIFVKQHWREIVASANVPCPIVFTEAEEVECLRLDDLEQEVEDQLAAFRAMIGLGPEGWVSHDNYCAATEAIARMKSMSWEQAESELDRMAIRDHWVYDDMDEDEYL